MSDLGQETIASEEVKVEAVAPKKTKKKKQIDRMHVIGERLPNKTKINVNKDFWENIEPLLKQAILKYTHFSTPELDDSISYIKKAAFKNMAVREFEGLMREHFNNVTRGQNRYDSESGEVVQDQKSLIRFKMYKDDENPNLIFERDVLESLVDSVSKICSYLDPFNKEHIFICSIQ